METSEIIIGEIYQNVHITGLRVRVTKIEDDTVYMTELYDDDTDMEELNPKDVELFAKHYAKDSDKVFHDSEWFGDNSKKVYE